MSWQAQSKGLTQIVSRTVYSDVKQLHLDRVTYNFPLALNLSLPRLTHLRLTEARTSNRSLLNSISFPNVTHVRIYVPAHDGLYPNSAPLDRLRLDELAPQLELLALTGCPDSHLRALVDQAPQMTALRTLVFQFT